MVNGLFASGTNGLARLDERSAQRYPVARFCYEVVDLAGRALGLLERQAPLRAEDMVQLEGAESWRVVAVLGRTATVVRSSDAGT